MRSCCKQVREFVDFGKHLHGELSKLYEELDERAELERVHMLLEYLSRHEQHMQESLARFEKQSRSGLLDAWLEYSPSLDAEAVIAESNIPDKPSSDDLIKIALALDDTLVKLYREVAEKANDGKVKALFANLLALEESEKTQVVRAAMSLWDM
ncbi:hypothetical protein [Methylomagnum sp.]